MPYLLGFLAYIIQQFLVTSQLLYPKPYNIAINKPVRLEPNGYSCGFNGRISLRDNRFLNYIPPQFNSNIFCDQTCPYGKIIQDWKNDVKEFLPDFSDRQYYVLRDNKYFISNLTSNFSFFFENNEIFRKRLVEIPPIIPIQVDLYAYKDKSVIDGFTISFWFQQMFNNTGVAIELVDDTKISQFQLNIESSKNRIKISYLCSNDNKQIEYINTNNLINIESWNFLALRIYKNKLNLFINEPKTIIDRGSIEKVILECNFGQIISQNVNKLNAYIGVDKQGGDFYAGWLQDIKLAIVPLSYREIYSIYTKNTGEKLRYQNECKCPNDYPINENSKSIFCLTDETNLPSTARKVSYLNKDTHIAEFINDNSLRTSWISELTPKPQQKVSITIDFLNDLFILSQIEVYFTSYPPSDILLERYFDGKWLELQQYSLDCTQYNTNCISLPSNLLREIINGFTLLWSKRLVTNNTEELFEESVVNKLKATQVKITLSGFYDVVKSDLRKLYYSISELKVIAHCDCNGYSTTCNTAEVPYQCDCDKTSYTQGINCEKCLDSFNNKAYQSRYVNSSAICELCNCSSESIKCEYNSTIQSGICFDCKNNTEGPNCELCKKGFYRNSSTSYCESCNCNLNGTKETSLKECKSNGQCDCKTNVEGIRCDQCKEGYFSLSGLNPDGCRQCICNINGTIQNELGLSLCDDRTGQCECKSPKITGNNCQECADTYYDLPNGCSKECNCNSYGAFNSSCDLINGQCYCKSNVTGRACDECLLGYYNLTFFGCTSRCNCNPMGSIDNCDLVTGKCKCKKGYIGHECNECDDGYYETETRECKPCNCNFLGTLNNTIGCERLTGNCFCSETTKGAKCDSCKAGYWGLLNSNEVNVRDLALQSGCNKCDCDQDGTIMSTINPGLFICDEVNGQCPCKPLREGVKCDKCVSGYFLVELDTKECIKCGCHPTGTVPGTTCDFQTGECVCKTYNGVGGTRCDECLEGFYGFQAEIGLCQSCDCNLAGSINEVCDSNGKCACKDLVVGTKCDTCLEGTSNLNFLNPFGCSKKPSRQSSPTVEQKDSNSVLIRWNLPFYPNGIIEYYLLYRNNSLIFNATSQNITSYNDTSIEPYTLYSYVIESFNEQGSTKSRPISILTFPGRPCCKFYYKILQIYSRSIDIQWVAPERLNGQNTEYIIILSNRSNNENTTITVQHNDLVLKSNDVTTLSFSYSITNLSPYTQYEVSISACNRNVKEIYCLRGIDQNLMRLTKESVQATVFTLQDKPQDQPSPILTELESKSATFLIEKPEKPNGIIILYELWLKQLDSMSIEADDEELSCDDEIIKGKLICAIEEWYDPFSTQLKNQTRICRIDKLRPYTWYSVTVASSTIIGRGEFSPRLRFMTEEDTPLCSPRIIQAVSQTFDSVFLEWEPDPNNLTMDYINCIRGKIVRFQIFQLESDNITLRNVANTTLNKFIIGNLNGSSSYNFKLSVCNQIGCILNENFTLINTISAPPDRNQSKPEFEFINSTSIRFKWLINSNDKLVNNRTNMTYKLERFSISFSYPPASLEAGVRFHGYNYFTFKSPQYFPDGYPFFGVNLTLKSTKDSSLFYFAESQNDLHSIQFINNNPVYVSNIGTCFSYLTIATDISRQKWYRMRASRTTDETLLSLNSESEFQNTASCSSIEITDVQDVYVGGVPQTIVKQYEPRLRKSNGRDVRLRNLNGCIKDASTLVRYSKIKPFELEPSIESSSFNFDDSEVSPGEPTGSNAIFGCPTSGLDDSSIYFLGFGFLSIKLSDQLANNQFFSYEAIIRTQLSRGILFFAYDVLNSDYLLINIINSTALSVRMSYYANVRNVDSFTRTLTLKYNKTVRIPDLANGNWFDFRFNLDLKNYRLFLSINGSFLINDNLAAQLVAQNLIFQSTQLDLYVHLSSEYYLGGINWKEANEKIENILNNAPPNFAFNSQFNLLSSINDDVYFSGCIKSIKIKGSLLNFADDLNLLGNVKYRHVRFDGCPKPSQFKPMQSEFNNYLTETNNRLATVFEGNFLEALDTQILPSTEYFYRITASNPYGDAFSEWSLVRAPASAPFYPIKLSFLDIQFESGYRFYIINLGNYCVYCKGLYLDDGQIFSGIVTAIGFIVKEKSTDTTLTNTRVQCSDFCYEDLDVNLFIEINTFPIQNYTIQVDVCTQFECKRSDKFELKTPVEPPIEVNAPQVISRTIDSLLLEWKEPNKTNGEIERYILRRVNLNTMQNIAIYAGLQTQFNVSNLKPFRKYTFFLEACNKAGCNSSQFVTFITSEQPPINVSLPTILKKSQDSLLIRWEKPTSLEVTNGIVTNFILYIDEVLEEHSQLQPISLVYNITVCSYCSFYIQNVYNLRAGTLYVIRLSVCTGGGCKNSSDLYVRTNESEPFVDDIFLYPSLRTAQSIQVSWNKTKFPNGKIILYKLYLNDQIIYEGLNIEFLILNLNSFTFYRFYLDVCNNFACSRTRVFKISTDEDVPTGKIQLEATSIGSNEIKLRFRSVQSEPFVPNGHIVFAIYVEGPFVDYCNLPKSLRKQKCIKNSLVNLLNATMLNTIYGITENILAYSNYSIYVNATNTKGFVLSNKVDVSTDATKPSLTSSPIAINLTSRNITLEWQPPLLINSPDSIIFYQIEIKEENSEKIEEFFEKETLATYATVTGLKPFTLYSFRLKVSNTFGKDESVWSKFYQTLEELPVKQHPVEIVNIKSRSVSVKWKPPLEPNGLIVFYYLIIFKNDLIHRVFVIDGNKFQYTINHLVPFEEYLLIIGACNSVGCIYSFRFESPIVKTLPAKPEGCKDLILSSLDSYLIQVNWSPPLYPNGLIIYYVIERKIIFLTSDYNKRQPPNRTIKSYRFSSNMTNFTNYDDIESCGLYSYRIFAYNSVGYCVSSWRNVSAKESKPLFVYTPEITHLDETSITIEWQKPVSYCKIIQYTIIVKSEKDTFNQDAQNIYDKFSLKNLIPFTKYELVLKACVTLDLCTKSTSKIFQTLGTSPSGLKAPFVKIISSKIISITWLEPLNKNGKDLNYQLIRSESNTRLFNNSQMIYFGNKTFYTDTNIKFNYFYKYMIVYGNEFGNALSEWSSVVETFNENFIRNYSARNEMILFDLQAKCESPSVAYLNWTNYDVSDIRRYLNTFTTIKKKYPDVKLKEYTILLIDYLTVNIERNMSTLELKTKNLSQSSYLIKQLLPSTEYTFYIKLYVELKSFRNLNPIQFEIISEKASCNTTSIIEAYDESNEPIIKFKQINESFVNVTIRLEQTILDNYDQFNLILNENFLYSFNQSFYKNFSSVIVGPLKTDILYFFSIKSCNSLLIKQNVTNEVFSTNHCIESKKLKYLMRTRQDINLPSLNVMPLNSSSVKLFWNNHESNGIIEDFILYRRYNSCESESDIKPLLASTNFNRAKVNCNGVFYDQIDGYECCDSNYLFKKYSEFMICCGGEFHLKKTGYQCCAGVKYLNVPEGQICCPNKDVIESLKETRVIVGYGDECCLDKPYFKNDIYQSCCKNKIISKLEISNYKYYDILFLYNYGFSKFLNKRQCEIQQQICIASSYQPIYKGNSGHVIDSNLLPNILYEYQLCSKNVFGTVCQKNLYFSQKNNIPPENFIYFTYKILNDSSIEFSWKPPIKENGQIKSYKLFRDSKLVFEGLALRYNDGQLTPYRVYNFTLQACNEAGCVNSSKALYLSTLEKSLTSQMTTYSLTTLNSSSIELKWNSFVLPNVIIRNYIIEIKEIFLKIDINLNLYTTTNSARISGRENRTNINLEFLSVYSDRVEKEYTLIFTDLIPNSIYTFKMSHCNKIGCVALKNNGHSIKTRSAKPVGFDDPIVFALDSKNVEVVWKRPLEPNGDLLKYCVYLNDETKECIDTNGDDEVYSYVYSKLEPKTTYSIRIEAINSENISLMNENKVYIQTPKDNFINICPQRLKLKQVNETLVLNVMDLVEFQAEPTSPTKMIFKFENKLWRQFLNCINETNIISKLLLFSFDKGLQAFDFPFYNENTDEDIQYEQTLFGLQANTLYSIRFTVLTKDTTKIYTSKAIQVKTLNNKPCCELNTPKVTVNSKSKNFIIKWNKPDFPNSDVLRYQLVRGKIKGMDCLIDWYKPIIEKQSTIELKWGENIDNEPKSYLFNQITSDFIAIDTNDLFYDSYGYYLFKIIALNDIGSIESNWSKPTLIWQFEPNVPSNLVITNVHQTGFYINFKEPLIANSIISHYEITLEHKIASNRLSRQSIIVKSNLSCNSSYFNDYNQVLTVPINGLIPNTQYKISLYVYNAVNDRSKYPNLIYQKTLPSAPRGLEPLGYKLRRNIFTGRQSINFNFVQPLHPSGNITSYNLYLVNRTALFHLNPNDLVLIYKGLQTEYQLANVTPSYKYSFTYSVCNQIDCTFKMDTYTIDTYEERPRLQRMPLITKDDLFNCFHLSWQFPLIQNGKIRRFELYKLIYNPKTNKTQEVHVISMDPSNNSNQSLVYDDCDVNGNYLYSYKIKSVNREGSAQSNYTRLYEISSNTNDRNEFLNKIKLKQLNHKAILLNWTQLSLRLVDRKDIYCNIYRNGSLIGTFKLALNETNFRYVDYHEFLPKTTYNYQLQLCFNSNCSFKNRTKGFVIQTYDRAPLSVDYPKIIQYSNNFTLVNASGIAKLFTNTQSIAEYQLYLNDSLVYKGKNSTIQLKNLKAFSKYFTIIKVCTFTDKLIIEDNEESGCKASKEFEIITFEDIPKDLNKPDIKPIRRNQTHEFIQIKWKSPKLPNGLLKSIVLKRNDQTIFKTSNINIQSFNDILILLTRNYTYELIYENSVGKAKSEKIFPVIQELPKDLNPAKCSSKSFNELIIEWSEPEMTNGEIILYMVSYRNINTNKQQNLTINANLSTSHRLILKDLLPQSLYLIDIYACNARGCISSRNQTKCKTQTIKISNIYPPICYDFINEITNLISIHVTWKIPTISYGQILNYSLVKESFNNKTDIIYTGIYPEYVDFNVKAYTVYRYSIIVNHTYGYVQSNWTEFHTRPIRPSDFDLPASILDLNSDSVTLKLNLPNEINGYINKIILLYRKLGGTNEPYAFKEIYSASKDSLNLLETSLNRTILNELNSNTNYEIKSQICNQIACVTSSKFVSFKTYSKVKIFKLTADDITSNSFSLHWNIDQQNELFNQIIFKYKIILQEFNSDPEVYYTYDTQILFNNLKPFYIYKVNVSVIDSNNTSLDSSVIDVTTLPSKPIYLTSPSFNIILNSSTANTTFSFKTIEINWNKSFELNSQLIRYTLKINNVTKYVGTNTKFELLAVDDCIRINNIVDIYFIDDISVQVEITTNGGSETSPLTKYDYECSNAYNSKVVYKDYWWSIILVVISSAILLVIIWLCIYYCTRRVFKMEKSQIQVDLMNFNSLRNNSNQSVEQRNARPLENYQYDNQMLNDIEDELYISEMFNKKAKRTDYEEFKLKRHQRSFPYTSSATSEMFMNFDDLL